jgi:hypothetical protein
MKILICTLQLGLNYGGILQAFALNNYLREAGVDAKTFIDHRHQKSFKGYLRRMLECIPFHNISGIKNDKIKRQRLLTFVDSHIPILKSNGKSLSDVIRFESIDVLVIGSDQVWREAYNRDVRSNFLPKRLEVSNIVSYAASFGESPKDQPKDYLDSLSSSLDGFSAISCREEDAVNFCSKELEYSSEHVCDPTLLLDKTIYDSLIPAKKGCKYDQGILIYGLDFDCKDFASKVCNSDSTLKPYFIDHQNHDIEDFLWCFSNASYVITDSYHGFVFALIYKKPVIVVMNKSRGFSRFESLNKKIGGVGILVENIDDAISKANALDFGSYDSDMLTSFISKSIRFIEENITGQLG